MDERLRTATEDLVATGRKIYARGWVPATSGNLSGRVSLDRIAITVSGADKGALCPADIMLVDLEGRAADARRPSAETGLHTALYKRYPDVGAVLHVHSLNTTLLSKLVEGHIALEGYELLKALRGIDTHQACVMVPIFPNDQDVAKLAERIDSYLDAHEPVYGYLISGHGLYAWGADVGEAFRHLEAFEFLFECELKLRGMSQ